MATKQAFTTEEWDTIVSSPMLASTAVTLADPSGLWGIIKEGASGVRALLDAKKDPSANELIKAVAMEYEVSEGRSAAREALKARLSGNSPAELKVQALEGLDEAGKILDRKAPNDAAAFKQFLTRLAEQVAEAAKEGGFLGFGGVRVSEAEKVSVAEVATTLG